MNNPAIKPQPSGPSFWGLSFGVAILGLALGVCYARSHHPPVTTILAEAPVQVPSQEAQPPPLGPQAKSRHISFAVLQTAIREALALPTQGRQEDALCQLASTIELADIPSLMPPLGGYSNPLVTENLAAELYRRWARVNAPQAWACAHALPAFDRRLSALKAVTREWAKTGLEAITTKVKAESSGDLRRQLIETLATAMADINPRQALAAAATWGQDQHFIEYTVLRQWAQKAPAEAAQALAGTPFKRGRLISDIVCSWAARDPASAFAWVKSLPGINPFGDFQDEAISALAILSPKLATEYVQNIPAKKTRDKCLNIIANALSQYDINAAVTWAGQLPEGNGKQCAQCTVARNWINWDPAGAVTYADSLATNQAGKYWLMHMLNPWIEIDPQAAANWIMNKPEGEYRDSMVFVLVQFWALQEPADAGTFVSHLPPGKLRDQSAQLVLARWAQLNPRGAAAWLIQFPECQARTDGMSAVVENWAQQDHAGAGEWLKKLPPDAASDAGLAAYAHQVTQTCSPEMAIQWAKEIHEEARRNKYLESVGRDWLRHDPKAARAWIEKSELPTETKQKLLGGQR